MSDNKIAILADRLTKLTVDYQQGKAALLKVAHEAGIDPVTLQRLAGLALTDADTIGLLQQEIRLLEQLLYDAERVIEYCDYTIDRLARDLENQRRHAIKVDDYGRPEVVAQALEPTQRSWPRSRRQALADRILRRV